MTDPTPPAGDAPLPEDAPPEATQLPTDPNQPTEEPTTDGPSIGGRLDAAVERANVAITELRSALSEKAAEIGAEVNAKVDEIQAAIDEIQAVRTEDPARPGRLTGPPNQLPDNG